MGLDETEVWDLEKNVGTRSPILYMLDWNTDFGHTTFEGCQGGATKASVIVCKAHRPNEAVYDVKRNRYVYVDAGIQSGGTQMNHYSNDESEEGEQVLDNKKFVGEVPKRR